jgi:hypothetical protein
MKAIRTLSKIFDPDERMIRSCLCEDLRDGIHTCSP